jgi:hypothetical protein
VTERAPAGWVYGVQLQIERPNLLGKGLTPCTA